MITSQFIAKVLPLAVFVMCVCRPLSAQETAPETEDSKITSKPTIYTVSIGLSGESLENPSGFDVPSSEFKTDGDNGSTSLFTILASAERPFAWQDRARYVVTASLDGQDFDGLGLKNVSVGAGLLAAPASRRPFGIRASAGVGLGITRSETFFDRANHLSSEVWARVGLQISVVVIDLTHRLRQAGGSELDGRTADPRTTVTSLTLGYMF